MNQQVKEKWITALRSGEYTQAREFLRTDYGYCCLGVLTDLYLKEVNEQWVPFSESEGVFYLYDDRESCLSPKVSEWAGVDHYTRKTLVNMNDVEVKSFNQIADYIQKTL
jgi:hypothetical protein